MSAESDIAAATARQLAERQAIKAAAEALRKEREAESGGQSSTP